MKKLFETKIVGSMSPNLIDYCEILDQKYRETIATLAETVIFTWSPGVGETTMGKMATEADWRCSV